MSVPLPGLSGGGGVGSAVGYVFILNSYIKNKPCAKPFHPTLTNASALSCSLPEHTYYKLSPKHKRCPVDLSK